MFDSLKRAIGERLAAFLSKDLPGYQRLDAVAIDVVAGTLEKGDIVLVDGNTRISTAIKYLTQSTWSHACLYVGEKGAKSSQLNLLEANLKNGVHLTSLDHYGNLKNVVDLIRYIIQKPAVPNRYRRALLSLGSGEPTKAICSTLIAESFQSINYPILPQRNRQSGEAGELPLLYKQHFTHFTPRDFDLSPYFRIVKPTIEYGFDHHSLAWEASGVETGPLDLT